MEEQFKPGDVVRLKSGGPKMTVTGIEGNAAARVLTVWYRDRDQDYSTGAFHEQLLVKVTE